MVTALYRRYRPEDFAEMIGQSQVTDPLMTALRTGRVGHAYLFSGPRGCGKTTSARILARCLNCAEGPTDTPCGTCPSCVELSRDGGGSLDVVEIDAASHGGVDDARDLRERAVFAPARDRFKIFIIDEAHMVTPGGFNALLKIVEEPPPHVKFVFATTEPDKVIGTIRSRTHHYPFRLIAPATLIDYVQTLCDSEGVDVEAGVLPLLGRAGGGSVRDTLSILDQLIAGSQEGRVTKSRAAGLLGFTHSELLDDVVAALGSKDAAAAFRATDRVVQTGQDPRRFVEDLLERLRDLIVVGATNVQGAAAVFRGVPEDQLQRMFEQARVFRPGELSKIADTVSAALDHMAGATAPRLQLELMIARALVQIGGESAAADAAGAMSTAGSAAGPSTPAQQPPATPSATSPATPPAAREPGQPAVAPQNGSAGASTTQPQQADQATHSAAGAQPAAAQPAGADTSGAASALNAAEAARAAREFLRTDSAGAASFGRPVTDVLGMIKEPQTPAAAASAAASRQQPVTSGDPQQSAQTSQPQSASNGDSQRPGAAESGPPRGPESDAGSSQAPSTPQPSQPPAQPGQVPAPAAQAPAVQDGETGFEELVGMWPDLLEEILEADRDAWNAVHSVQPLAFEGDVLTLGFASESDLTVFKASGAGPLRETILAAFGVRVRYVPKAVPAPSGQATAPAQTQGAARETGGSPQVGPAASEAAEEPRPGASPAPTDSAASARQAESPQTNPEPGTRQAAAQAAAQEPVPAPVAAESAPAVTEPAPDEDPLLKAAAARVAALQGRVSAHPRTPTTPQAPAQSPSQSPAPSDHAPSTDAPAPSTGAPAPRAADPEEYPSYYADGPFADEDPYGGQAGDPYLNTQRSDPAPAQPETASAARASGDPATSAQVPQDAEAPASSTNTPTSSANAPARDEDAPAKKSAPSFTRYGEAVVREVLGARFIEERPFPETREG